MAISLLGSPNLAGLSNNIAINPSGKVTTASSLGGAQATGQAPMGVTAKSPTTNISAPPSTLPSSQVAPPSQAAINAAMGTSQSQLPPAPVAPTATIPSQNTGLLNQAYQASTGSPPVNPQQAAQQGGNPYVAPLASTATTGSANSTQATQGLLQAPSQNAQISQQAQDIDNQYGNAISKISNYGNALAGSYINGAGLAPVSQGLAGQAQQTTAAEIQGQQAAEQAALNPLTTELAAQQQAQSGLSAAGTNANTQQQNTQSGLNQAGTLAQPIPTQPGQPVFNPATGQYTTGGGASTATPTQAPAGYSQADWNQIVSNVANGNLGAISGLPTVLQAQAQAAAQAQNPNFNINTAVGQATGQQAQAGAGGQAAATNIETAGTAATTGTSAALQSSIGTYNTLSAYNSAATQQATTVQNVLQSTGLNQGVPIQNQYTNSLLGGVGSPKVTALTTAITEMQSQYSQLLSAGGTQTPTSAEQQALSILSPSSTPAQIQAAIGQLQQAAYNKLNGQYTQLQTEQAALQSSSTSGGSTGNVSYDW